MISNIKLDAREALANYQRAFQRFKELPGFDHKEILRAEAGSILKKWAGLVKVTTQNIADRRSRVRANIVAGTSRAGDVFYGTTINSGLRGGRPGVVYMSTFKHKRDGGAKTFVGVGRISDGGNLRIGEGAHRNRHFSRDQWQDIQSKTATWVQHIKRIFPLGRQSIGFSRQSVVQIADDLGIDLNTVSGQGISGPGLAKARAAIASSGKSYKNGSGTEGGDKEKAYVQLFNRLPYNNKIGMDRNLAEALSGRAKFIETAYAKGTFDSMRKVAAAFPNFRTAA